MKDISLKEGLYEKVFVKRWIWITVTACWCIFIFIRSSKPADISNQESLFFVDLFNNFIKSLLTINYDIITQALIRKTAHFTEYLITGFLMFGCVNNSKITIKRAFASVALAVFYAVTDEIHQYFVPGRAMRMFDIFIDSMGVITGVFVAYRTWAKLRT